MIRPHHDIEAEASVLGGILLRPALLARLGELEVDDFYSPKHQHVFAAMRNLAAKAEPIDPVTVAGELVRRGVAAAVGNTTDGSDGEFDALAFVGILAARVPSPDNVTAYARTVQEHRSDRDAIRTLKDCIGAIDSPDNEGDPDMRGDGFIQWARSQLGRLKLRGAQDTSLPIAKIVSDRCGDYDKIHEAKQRGVPLMLGCPTGIKALDELIGGYPIGIGTVIAGRPGSGKSSNLRAAADACSRAGIGAHTFSLEDLRSGFADRAIASESGVPIETLRTGGHIQQAQMYDLGVAINRLKSRRHWLVDDGMMTAAQVVARWRRRGDENETKLVAVDYLQRLRKSDARMSDFDHVAESMTILCDAAKDDRVAVIIGSQLNRECEKRDDKRPQLSDMRGGGPIEELSKCVIGVYRGAMYGGPVEGVDWSPDMPHPLNRKPFDDDWLRRMELLMLKHNDGATGRVFARWDGPTTTVS